MRLTTAVMIFAAAFTVAYVAGWFFLGDPAAPARDVHAGTTSAPVRYVP